MIILYMIILYMIILFMLIIIFTECCDNDTNITINIILFTIIMIRIIYLLFFNSETCINYVKDSDIMSESESECSLSIIE